MAARPERLDQRHWVISQTFTHRGIERKAFWGSAGAWKNGTHDPSTGAMLAALFKSKKSAQAKVPTLPEIREVSIKAISIVAAEAGAGLQKDEVRYFDSEQRRLDGERTALQFGAGTAHNAVAIKIRNAARNSATIISHGGGYYSIGNTDQKQFTGREDGLAQAFIGYPTMDTRSMRQSSKVSRPVDVLRQLARRDNGMFAPAIEFPGRKGPGYILRVRRAEST